MISVRNASFTIWGKGGICRIKSLANNYESCLLVEVGVTKYEKFSSW